MKNPHHPAPPIHQPSSFRPRTIFLLAIISPSPSLSDGEFRLVSKFSQSARHSHPTSKSSIAGRQTAELPQSSKSSDPAVEIETLHRPPGSWLSSNSHHPQPSITPYRRSTLKRMQQ
ncbi:hypothetical protein EX30DRAFT_344199 [Ascodesmis nigricans]|uniref:Uncharacterized protein n=1 Tax=Ascodesmis nigricans TaxID=341454 RepID=A0A4S2MJY7_9PEZI|nr:hypothetical protein EX30DRAFT_344199 [Ascodesmis nigricans]